MNNLNRPMLVIKSSLLMASLFTSLTANAIADSCTLLRTAVPSGVNMSQGDIEWYQLKLQKECDITMKYRNARAQLQQNFGVSIENLNEYQGMRFVRRVNYNESKYQNLPIEKTYQIKKTDYLLPVEQRSSVIWDNWMAGLTQLPQSREKLLSGGQFSVEDLKRVHKGFFTLSKEEGDAAHAPDEGTFKPEAENDNYWWDFKDETEGRNALNVVTEVNEHYRSLGLIPTLADGGDYTDVLKVKKAINPKTGLEVWAIYSGDSRINRTHVKTILNFVNTMTSQALTGNHMVWNGKLLSPVEVAVLAQKFYVGVHPFSEGNGRTSRFIQELFMTAFDMPHGSSGDLMDNDVLMTFSEYYHLTLNETLSVVRNVEGCLESYRANRMNSANQIRSNAAAIYYNCRLIN